jgi:aminopeptidase YwaD
MASSIDHHLQMLAAEIGPRPTGSAANRQAQAYIARVLVEAGCAVEAQVFDCLDWQCRGVSLRCQNHCLAVQANPFTPPCNVTAPFVILATLADLEQSNLTGQIAVLTGELSAEALLPKNFPFFQVESHQRIVQHLEAAQPAAILMVSHQDQHVAPLIEDGDFMIPSATVPASVGDLLLSFPAEHLSLRIDAVLHPAQAANVIGRRSGYGEERIVICAHFDTKPGTPGALDNAAGVATMLGLAQATEKWQCKVGLEFIAFNGEDNYVSAGQVAYLQQYGSTYGNVLLCINLDGVGWRDARTTIALFGLSELLSEKINALLVEHPLIVQAEPWPQGDHMIFVMQGLPALAFTSEGIHNLIDSVIHTPNDSVEIVSVAAIIEVVQFLSSMICLLSR